MHLWIIGQICHLPRARRQQSLLLVSSLLFLTSCGQASRINGAQTVLQNCHVTYHDFERSLDGTKSTAPITTSFIGISLRIDGSTALQPLIQQGATEFANAQRMQMTVAGGGSVTGLQDVETSKVEIGMSDLFYQEMAATSTFRDLVDHRVAAVAFTVIVSDDVHTRITNLTTQNLQGIFQGRITNWRQLDGPDEPIVVFDRNQNSGTHATFEQYVLNARTGTANPFAQVSSTTQEIQDVQTHEGAIGYVSTDYVLSSQYRTGISPMCINGYGATTSNINLGYYPFWSYEHAYTKGTPNPAEQAFLDYLESPAFQDLDLLQLGFLQLNQISQTAQTSHVLPSGAG